MDTPRSTGSPAFAGDDAVILSHSERRVSAHICVRSGSVLTFSGLTFSALALEELHRAFVLFGGRARLEGAEIAAPAGLRVELARIEAVFARFELADHGRSPASMTGIIPTLEGANGCARGAETAGSRAAAAAARRSWSPARNGRRRCRGRWAAAADTAASPDMTARLPPRRAGRLAHAAARPRRPGCDR